MEKQQILYVEVNELFEIILDAIRKDKCKACLEIPITRMEFPRSWNVDRGVEK